MFNEFSQYLTENSPYSDFWYDDGCVRANEMLCQFTQQDWQKLAEFLPIQNEEWQRICFERIAEDNSASAQNFILQHLDHGNTFLQHQVLDTLNEQLANNFLSEKQKAFFSDSLLRISFP